MASSFRRSSIRAEFEDVLKTVGRGFAPRSEDEFAPEETDISFAMHSSFEFLQALDTVSDQRSTPAGPEADDLRSFYSDTELEAKPETTFPKAATEIDAEDDPDEEDETEVQAAESKVSGPDIRSNEPKMSQAAPYDPPDSCDPASLAAELGLRAGMTRLELQRLRRRFALKNHPDRLAPSRREMASRRMKIANSLIDAALRRAGP